MAVPWITAADLANPSDPYAEQAAAFASWILYKLTAEKYPGLRTSTEWIGLRGVNPETCETFTNYGDFTWVSYAPASAYKSVKLRGQPVVSVVSVNNGGTELDPADFRLVNHSTIQATGCAWDINRGITVTYRHGTKPPMAGIFAAIRLGDELVLSMHGDENCALPANTQSVSRQGINVQFVDPLQFLENGRVGLYEVDLFIAASNPTRARKRAKVFSPNIPRGERY